MGPRPRVRGHGATGSSNDLTRFPSRLHGTDSTRQPLVSYEVSGSAEFKSVSSPVFDQPIMSELDGAGGGRGLHCGRGPGTLA
ncbi:unnamed protein product [Boreogadus saida]